MEPYSQESAQEQYKNSKDLDDERNQEQHLPIANVQKLMKDILDKKQPKISKDAKELVQECVSEFISLVTVEAVDKCTQQNRKTINGDDLIESMKGLGFDEYAEILKVYQAKYKKAWKQENM